MKLFEMINKYFKFLLIIEFSRVDVASEIVISLKKFLLFFKCLWCSLEGMHKNMTPF